MASYAETYKTPYRKVLRDKSLSFGARGLYALLQSYGIQPGDTVDVSIIRQFSSIETDDELTSLIVELQQAGLVKDSVF